MPVKISPSIFGADFSDLRSELRKTEEAGADSIHFDIMDRHFVPNLTFGPHLMKALRKHTRLPFGVHLMTENPDLYIKECYDAGADTVTVHPEACIHLHRTLSAIRELGMKAGVAVNPSTPLSFYPYTADLIDEILIMTVNPGFSGQKTIKRALAKVSEAYQMIKKEGFSTSINVDGGMNISTAPEAIALGADTLVMASAFYGADDPAGLIKKVKEIKLRGEIETY